MLVGENELNVNSQRNSSPKHKEESTTGSCGEQRANPSRAPPTVYTSRCRDPSPASSRSASGRSQASRFPRSCTKWITRTLADELSTAPANGRSKNLTTVGLRAKLHRLCCCQQDEHVISRMLLCVHSAIRAAMLRMLLAAESKVTKSPESSTSARTLRAGEFERIGLRRLSRSSLCRRF